MSAGRVQSAVNSSPGYATTGQVTFGSNVTAGNLIVVVVKCNASIVSMTDTQGNTYNRIGGAVGNYGGVGDLWYAYNVNGGAVTITVSTSPEYSDFSIVAKEYSGILTTDPLDVFNVVDETAFATAHSTGSSGTPSQDNQLVVGAITYDDSTSTLTAGGGLGNLTQVVGGDAYSGAGMADKDMTTASAQSGSFTTTNYTNCQVFVALFKEAPSTSILKVSGVAQASIGEIINVANASIDKVAGVANMVISRLKDLIKSVLKTSNLALDS